MSLKLFDQRPPAKTVTVKLTMTLAEMREFEAQLPKEGIAHTIGGVIAEAVCGADHGVRGDWLYVSDAALEIQEADYEGNDH